MFNGITLTKHTSPFYCAKSRLMLGLVFGLVQVAIIVQASESTTKKVRRWMLVIVAYVTASGNLLSILLFYFFDDRKRITYTEENPAIYILCYIIGGIGSVALIVNLIATTDTVPFLLNHGNETKAFKEMSRLKMGHLSMLDIRYEYERIRFETAQEQLEGNRSLGSHLNYGPLSAMCYIRILNLLFTSVPMTLLLIWDPDTSSIHESNDIDNDAYNTSNSTASASKSDENYVSPLFTLAVLQGFRMLCSIIVIIRQDKYHFNRFCYKLAFVCGLTLLIWFFVRTVLGQIQFIQNLLFFPVSILIMMAFTGLPIPLDVIQMTQTADSYARIKNTWALAGAIFIENLFHMLLIIQMDLVFGVMFVFLVNGVAMMYFSWWLLKRIPNVVAIAPITVAIVARYPFKRVENEQSVHM